MYIQHIDLKTQTKFEIFEVICSFSTSSHTLLGLYQISIKRHIKEAKEMRKRIKQLYHLERPTRKGLEHL